MIQEKILKYDFWLLFLVLSLLTCGVIMVYSASSFKARELFNSNYYYLFRHVVKVVLALTVMFLLMRINYHLWLKISPWMVLASLVLLLFLLISPSVEVIRGSRRWLVLGPLKFQPSEMARFSLILFLASSIGRKDSLIKRMRHSAWIYFGIILIVVVPILLQPDVGTAILTMGILLLLIFIAGQSLLPILTFSLLSLSFFATYAYFNPEAKRRILEFILAMRGQKLSWQTLQSIIAFSNGGISGLGFGSSTQKFNFLPDPFTDFIYAIVGEELGFLGALGILVIFWLILWRGLQIAQNAPDVAGFLLGVGITLNIVVYALVNAGVVVNIFPTTGIPMPFLSYGGSALLMNLAGIGILLNISRQNQMKKGVYPVRNFMAFK
ncbi:MAG: cell division protein FtsW [Calditrichaeota bacterium]|nr:MAG: cell division protein FtsW [Calditrichota bacterium]